MSSIRHLLVLEWPLGLLGSDFHSKRMDYSRYNVFIYNLIFYVGLGRREWMDGIGWVRMMTSQFGKRSPLASVLVLGLLGLVF